MMRFRSLYLPVVLFSAFALRCGGIDAGDEAKRLIDTDREFSAYSVEHGAGEAFRMFLLDEALQLPAGKMPIRGREGIYREMMKDTGRYTLSWEPQDGEVAASGDLGYSWGIYTVTFPDDAGGVKTRRGKYLNVWKKNREGEWRVLVDTGNPNPEEGGDDDG